AGIDQTQGAMHRFENWQAREACDSVADFAHLLFGYKIAARDDDGVGTAQFARRLAEQSARRQVAVAPWVRRVDQHQVELPRKPAVLKAVVEDEDFAFEFLEGQLRELDAIRALQVRDIGQVLFEDHRLIVEPIALAVAAAEDRDAVILAEIARDILDARSF